MEQEGLKKKRFVGVVGVVGVGFIGARLFESALLQSLPEGTEMIVLNGDEVPEQKLPAPIIQYEPPVLPEIEFTNWKAVQKAEEGKAKKQRSEENKWRRRHFKK